MTSKKFCDITVAQELVSYLRDSQRLNGIKYFTKYMKLSSVIDMLTSGLMLINNPENMNDLYEYRAFSPRPNWHKICFSSFIAQSEENMAMWSMYAQPWVDGVMVSVSASLLRELIQSDHLLINAEYDEEKRWYTPGNTEIVIDKAISIIRVAYIDGLTLTCTGRDDRNAHFPNPYTLPELAGYIKDAAWAYEKEVRLRVDLPDTYDKRAIYLKLPESFLKQLIITTGPRFAGSVLASIPQKFRTSITINASKFAEKLAWIPCDTCKR